MQYTVRKGYITEDMISPENLIYFAISKEEVESENYDRVNHLLEICNKNGKKAYGIAMITFMYDDDSREVYEIPEICKYMLNIFSRYQELFYYLIPKLEPNIPLTYCLGGVKVVKKDIKETTVDILDINNYRKCLELITQGTFDYGKKLDDIRVMNTLKSLKLIK